MTNLPPPSCYLTYPGDVRRIVGEVKGPNYLGEWMTAVTADHDPIAQTTRVGFAIGVHGDLGLEQLNHLRWGRFLQALRDAKRAEVA